MDRIAQTEISRAAQAAAAEPPDLLEATAGSRAALAAAAAATRADSLPVRAAMVLVASCV
jgi:hypothetical protein